MGTLSSIAGMGKEKPLQSDPFHPQGAVCSQAKTE